MIKTFEQYNEMDPYGEEDWGNDFKDGDLLISKVNLYVGYERVLTYGELYIIGGRSFSNDDYIIITPYKHIFVTIIKEKDMRKYFDKK